jgi:hypothetical protein
MQEQATTWELRSIDYSIDGDQNSSPTRMTGRLSQMIQKSACRHSFPGCRGCPPKPVIVGNMGTISQIHSPIL